MDSDITMQDAVEHDTFDLAVLDAQRNIDPALGHSIQNSDSKPAPPSILDTSFPLPSLLPSPDLDAIVLDDVVSTISRNSEDNALDPASFHTTVPNSSASTPPPKELSATDSQPNSPHATKSPNPISSHLQSLPVILSSTRDSNVDALSADQLAAIDFGHVPQIFIPNAGPTNPRLPYSSSRTGLVYDSRMKFHMEINTHGQETTVNEDLHPEDPRRIFEIFRALGEDGLVEPQNEDFNPVLSPKSTPSLPSKSSAESGVLSDPSSTTPNPHQSSSPHPAVQSHEAEAQELADDIIPSSPSSSVARPSTPSSSCTSTAGGSNDQKLLRIPARPATAAEICLVHSPEHYAWVSAISNLTEPERLNIAKTLDSVYLHPMTFYSATLAAGGAIEACRAVVAGAVKNAIAVIRPPGHHAEHGFAAGFCFFNNVCVATRVCQRDFPDKCKKVLILDWDVHHGNGIQNIFESDPNVLYISLHVHRNGQFYPQGPAGSAEMVGVTPAEGKNINIPWPQHQMGDGDYLHAFQRVVLPVAQEFNPDLVIISAGFDAAEGDLLGQCRVTPAGFAQMTHMLMSVSAGKVVACLEGGYNLASIAKCALAVTRTLMGEPPARIPNTEPCFAAVSTISTVIRIHSRYWKCLFPKHSPSTMRTGPMAVGSRMDMRLRGLQATQYYDDFNMVRFYNFPKPELATEWRDLLVLGSDHYSQGGPIILLLHDSLEVNTAEDLPVFDLLTSNMTTIDLAVPFLARARNLGIAIVDVYIPNNITMQDVGVTTAVASDNSLLQVNGNTGPNNSVKVTGNTPYPFYDLVSKVWHNYIEVTESECYIIGIGNAASLMLQLLNNEDRCTSVVSRIFGFIGTNNEMPSANRPADDSFPQWYSTHSQLYLAANHPFFKEQQKKQRKKYGQVIRSSSVKLSDVIGEFSDHVFDRIKQDLKLQAPGPEPEPIVKAAQLAVNGTTAKSNSRHTSQESGRHSTRSSRSASLVVPSTAQEDNDVEMTEDYAGNSLPSSPVATNFNSPPPKIVVQTPSRPQMGTFTSSTRNPPVGTFSATRSPKPGN